VDKSSYIPNSPFQNLYQNNNNNNSWELQHAPPFLNILPENSKSVLQRPVNPSPGNGFLGSYIKDDIVYKDGEWYYYDDKITLNENQTLVDFWSEGNYDVSYCIYKGGIWKSNKKSQFKPDSGYEYYDEFLKKYLKYWDKISDDVETFNYNNSLLIPKWIKIPIWTNSFNYNKDEYVLYNGVVYKSNIDLIKDGVDPNKSNNWLRYDSLEPDTNHIYYTDNYIFMNNTLYRLKSNTNNSTLDNGIRIYVNKKWKNVLINIYINDNTLPNIKNTNRHLLYNSLYNKLVANNFINYINKITNRFDFSDTLKYTVIEDDYSIKEYDANNISTVKDLPIIHIDVPDPIFIQNNSLVKKSIYENNLKPFSKLVGNNINAFDQINYYNSGLMGVSIEENKEEPMIVDNYHGISNSIGSYIFRWSGNYSPLFYDIDVFESNNIIDYYEIQLATQSSGATFSFGTYSYSTFESLINGVTSSISNDVTISYLNPNSKYRFYEFMDNVYSLVLSIKFRSYDTNSDNWIKIQSIGAGNEDKSKVVRRFVNNTPISKSNVLNGNYKFDTYLTYFGVEREKIFRKVNRKESILKLKDTVGGKPIYPMLDDFGYHFTDFFIFKSSWDFEYHIETNLYKIPVKTTVEETKLDKIYEKNKTDIDSLVFDFESFGKVEDILVNSYGKIYDSDEDMRKTSGSFPIKIESDSIELNPFRPKNNIQSE